MSACSAGILRRTVLAAVLAVGISSATAGPATPSRGYASGGYARQTYNAPVRTAPPAASPSSGATASSAPKWNTTGAPPPVRYSGLAARETSSATKERERARRSLITDGPRPSAALQQQLDNQQRSSGTTAFLTGAFVAWLLADKDLSAADRGWLQSKLEALRARGLDGDEPVRLPPVAKGRIEITGPARTVVGQPQVYVVQWREDSAPLTCTVGDEVASGPAPLTMTWTPSQAGAFIVACKAGPLRQRTLVKVDPTGAS